MSQDLAQARRSYNAPKGKVTRVKNIAIATAASAKGNPSVTAANELQQVKARLQQTWEANGDILGLKDVDIDVT